MKDKRITIRLSESENAALERAATAKFIPPSTFARSLLITAINNDLNIMLPEHSLTPELDKLDPKVIFAFLRPLEIAVSAMRLGNVPQYEIEKALLFGVASEESELIHEFKSVMKCQE